MIADNVKMIVFSGADIPRITLWQRWLGWRTLLLKAYAVRFLSHRRFC